MDDFHAPRLEFRLIHLAALSLLGFLLYWIWSSFSLAFLHPLAKIPGPKLAAISDWWLIYHEWFLGQSLTDILSILHRKYGPVVRYGPRRVHFSTIQAYSDIYNINSKWDKDPDVYKAIVDTSSTFGLRDYHSAKQRRDIVWPFYSRQSVQKLQKAINRQIDILLRLLEKQSEEGKISNMSMAFRCLCQDIMADICLGSSFKTLEAKDFESPLIRSLDEGLKSYVLMKSFPTLRNFLYFLSSVVTIPGEAEFEAYGKIVEDKVIQGIRDPSNIPPHTMLGFLIPSPSTDYGELQQPKLSQEHMVEDLQMFVIGAGETVASAMTQCLSGVLQREDVYKSLYQELVEVWPQTAAPVPPVEDLERLPLLTATIKEGLRMTHGVVSPLPRIVSGDGAWIDSHYVSGGTSVGTSHVFIHMSSDYHHSPDKFLPERWLENSNHRYLVAFSKGPRSCIGINLAWCQLYLVLATLIRTVRMDYLTEMNDAKLTWKDCFQPLYNGKPLQVRCSPSENHS